jgi:hypothetical protein
VDRDDLFLGTLDELAARTRSGANEYDYLAASGLIRKLLIDGNPLAHEVNRTRRLRLRFEVTLDDLNLPPELPVPAFHGRLEGISPRLRPPRPLPTERISRDRFLGELAFRVTGEPFTVAEVIDHCAHVQGGIHAGLPRTQRERTLAAVNDSFKVDGVGPVARTMRGIGYVTFDGLAGLASRIREDREPPPSQAP